jgi:hypothetical protein
MTLLGVSKGFAFVLFTALATGCSGDDDASNDGPKACTTPNIDGSPFGSTGTATVHGSGTLPPGVPDGHELELLVNAGTFSTGVLPENLFDASYVCGRNFKFTIRTVEAGTYSLDYEIYPPNSTSTDPEFQGTSTNQFTVTDGQDLEFTATF